eukprot:TRINITY_DN55817_c0_g1_i1.p1 TRINITY_DN55817_c0_g1~~TRINITY_DN55817_c0_g1_i1.p1  ORF type:complete len:440 (+),score=123.79 TRINITY_DN55817_c0_g1_i1:70-1320(+)
MSEGVFKRLEVPEGSRAFHECVAFLTLSLRRGDRQRVRISSIHEIVHPELDALFSQKSSGKSVLGAFLYPYGDDDVDIIIQHGTHPRGDGRLWRFGLYFVQDTKVVGPLLKLMICRIIVGQALSRTHEDGQRMSELPVGFDSFYAPSGLETGPGKGQPPLFNDTYYVPHDRFLPMYLMEFSLDKDDEHGKSSSLHLYERMMSKGGRRTVSRGERLAEKKLEEDLRRKSQQVVGEIRKTRETYELALAQLDHACETLEKAAMERSEALKVEMIDHVKRYMLTVQGAEERRFEILRRISDMGRVEEWIDFMHEYGPRSSGGEKSGERRLRDLMQQVEYLHKFVLGKHDMGLVYKDRSGVESISAEFPVFLQLSSREEEAVERATAEYREKVQRLEDELRRKNERIAGLEERVKRLEML